MLTLDNAIKDADSVRAYIDQQLAARLIAELGYKWPDERVERVAQGAAKIFAETRYMPFSMSRAIEDELVMYGDGSIDKPIGLLISPSR